MIAKYKIAIILIIINVVYYQTVYEQTLYENEQEIDVFAYQLPELN